MHNKRFVRLYYSVHDKQPLMKAVKEFDWNHNKKIIKNHGLDRTRWKYFCEEKLEKLKTPL